MINSEFEIFFRTHFRSATFIAQRVVFSKEIAEDIVQDVFIKILNSDFSKIKYPTSFLNASVRNAAIDHMRKQTSHVFEQITEVEMADNKTIEELSAEEAEYIMNVNKLFAAIDQLPEQAKAIVKLVCIEKYSYQEAADKIGVSVNTVKTHMYRSFKNLKKNLLVFFI